MLKHAKTSPLKVALLALSPHNRAILEFFFAGAGRGLFRVVQAAEADAFILDYDHPGARADWEAHAAVSRKPSIVLSVHPLDLPDTVWLPKPLTSRALTDAAERVQELLASRAEVAPLAQRPQLHAPTLEKPLVQAAQHLVPRGGRASAKRTLVLSLPEEDDEGDALPPARPPQPEAPPAAAATVFDPAEADVAFEEVDRPVQPEIPREQAEQRWRLLCGEQADVQNVAQLPRFTPENYALPEIVRALRQARESGQATQVQFAASGSVVFVPAQGLAYCTLDTQSAAFAALCHNPMQAGQVGVLQPNAAALQQLEQQVADAGGSVMDGEAFVWVASLLTARGRLARDVDTARKVALKHWPNLTRLEQFPHIMRIAALWSQRPASPLEIARALNVPQRYVFAFYTAADALGLFEMDQGKLKSREKAQPKESRGFFSRLLKRLLGGGAK